MRKVVADQTDQIKKASEPTSSTRQSTREVNQPALIRHVESLPYPSFYFLNKKNREIVPSAKHFSHSSNSS